MPPAEKDTILSKVVLVLGNVELFPSPVWHGMVWAAPAAVITYCSASCGGGGAPFNFENFKGARWKKCRT